MLNERTKVPALDLMSSRKYALCVEMSHLFKNCNASVAYFHVIFSMKHGAYYNTDLNIDMNVKNCSNEEIIMLR